MQIKNKLITLLKINNMKKYFYIQFDSNCNHVTKSILLHDWQIKKINNFNTFNDNILFKSKNQIKQFLKNQ